MTQVAERTGFFSSASRGHAGCSTAVMLGWTLALGVVVPLLGALVGAAVSFYRSARPPARALRGPKCAGEEAPFAAPSAPAFRLDGFEVLGRVGRGPRGEVHRVVRRSDGKVVACKELPASEATAILRLARETIILQRLAHPHVLGRVAVGIAPGSQPYVVSELCEGPSLDEARLYFGDVPWALARLEEIADGLAALHASGLTHNNLKPENVLLARDSRALLADVGLVPLGGESPSPAADVHALGLIAEELLTRSRTGRAVVEAAGLPRYIARMLSACVDPDPKRRPRAADVRRSLELAACPVAVA